jgi:hypothetical protein
MEMERREEGERERGGDGERGRERERERQRAVEGKKTPRHLFRLRMTLTHLESLLS